MRTLARAGVITLAIGATLLGGAAAVQAAPAGAVSVSVNRLILEPGTSGHTGSVRVVLKNRTNEAWSGAVAVIEPIAGTYLETSGASGCTGGVTSDNRQIAYCYLDHDLAPGAREVLTVSFRSPAKPQAYPQIAPATGSVEVAGTSAEFPALFRSTTGSLRNPRPYVQDTASALTVTAGAVTLTPQADGTFAGHLPVTVRNDGDAPHSGLLTELVAPAGVDGAYLAGSGPCIGANVLPVPDGAYGVGCSVSGQLDEGRSRTFDWTITAPAGTPAGPLGTATTLVQLEGGPAQTGGANIAAVAVTVAG
ncbi:hypothetical protein GCM10010168_81130 [Actinoplanes ianthinogenes]|uniref:Uncharacterized protein n=1 Tax=Actinoplanes ianthinogenes TaxID=122358 RepID=A0ABM7LMW7_9ACTN|nr:hypothetical protein [Actinoplanes ianthinogenes]BCJ40553.1 hypothetical protein Aiant_12100 [Actinoplanes ianthinogenes]GGR50142.1 hypothetical protein GCM10010168_81130 [Actinoplanes ianthinogenes]